MVLIRNMIVTRGQPYMPCVQRWLNVIVNMHGDSLISNNLQFAYKAGTSTTQCTQSAREVISYYSNKGSDVYCCLLDCNKAFDKSKHDKLQEKLIAMTMKFHETVMALLSLISIYFPFPYISVTFAYKCFEWVAVFVSSKNLKFHDVSRVLVTLFYKV